MYERLDGVFSKEQIEKLHNANILLVGVGGVGSPCFEVLVRSGILNITIVDFDTYEESNLNRQLHSNKKVIGQKKTDILKKFANDLNENININVINEYINKESKIDLSKYDFIIDACDNIEAKVHLIVSAYKENIRIISSLGIGNRVNIKDLEITTIDKTYNDFLGKKLRTSLRKISFYEKVPVLFSKEHAIKHTPISSYIGVTISAGALLADYVIKEIIK